MTLKEVALSIKEEGTLDELTSFVLIAWAFGSKEIKCCIRKHAWNHIK